MSCGKRWRNLNPYDLHKSLINEYFLSKTTRDLLFKRDSSKDKRDIDVIRENHKFLWDEEEQGNLSWEKRLAKKYYDKLFKEYCIGDLRRYKENKIGLRWRTEQEVIDGKGQFSCGNLKCKEEKDLRSWEVNFGYIENGIKKNALVKLRLCPNCSCKLNYCHKKKEVKRLKQGHLKVKEGNNSLSLNDEREKKNEENFTKSEDVEVNRDSKSEKEVNDIWKQTNAEEDVESKTREEKFDEYLDKLFL